MFCFLAPKIPLAPLEPPPRPPALSVQPSEALIVCPEPVAPPTHRTAPPPPRPPPPRVPPPPPPVGWQIPPPVPPLPPILMPSPPLNDARSRTSSSSVSTPSPPVPPRPAHKAHMQTNEVDGLYDTMASNKAEQLYSPTRRVDVIENPIYMSMFSLKKRSLAKVVEKPETNGVAQDAPTAQEMPAVQETPATREIPATHDKELPPTPVENRSPSPSSPIELDYAVLDKGNNR
ncbi:unnamed protein product [Cylicostephanus goldi]|uniref:Uncharacterized protein n=1 Tax=Cylicostephanus goldi TaxID=71465 RepID=A0A3P7MUG1_CYLGO|nr:unnamed protein product [Cylicostephanus goldi]